MRIGLKATLLSSLNNALSGCAFLRQAVCGGLLTLLLCSSVLAGTTLSFTYTAQSHPGSRDRQVKVYVPDGLSAPAPMVMALHGCRQTHDDVLRDWGLVDAADRFGFILVTPFITTYDGLRNENCWGFWLEGHRHQGRGEPEDLHRIALEVESRLSVDPTRRHITGLSSGGAMSVVAAITHNEYWASAASAAGLPYGEDAASVSFSGCPGSASFHTINRVVSDMQAELNNTYPIPLMVLHNRADCTVTAPAGRNLRDAHLKAFGNATHSTAAQTQARQGPCTPLSGSNDLGCQHTAYTADAAPGSRSLVETVFYAGPINTPHPGDTDHGHYWIGGDKGLNGKWSLQRGPSYPDIVWSFFSRHPRSASTPTGHPQITLNGPNPLQIVQGQTFVDPGATAIDVEDGPVPVTADCSSVDTTRPDAYTCTYRASDSSGHVATVSRTVTVTAAAGCTAITASPSAHVAAGRAVAAGWFGLRAVSTGDQMDIGFTWNPWSQVTLYESAAGRWHVQRPAGCMP